MGKTYLIALSALLAGCLTVQTPEGKTIIAANATLKDGSSVKGEFRTERIVGSTLFMKKLDLDASLVKSVSFSGTNGESKVLLSNGDSFAMTISTKNFAIKSLLGDLSIPRENFRSLTLSRRTAAGGKSGLIFHCTFDDAASITSPVVGPKGTYIGGLFMAGKHGNALLTTVYEHNATFELPAGFFKTSGCIEFWAKIQKQSAYIGNGGDPRLFTITQKPSNNTISTIDIVSNNGVGNSGFATWTFLGNMASIRGMRHLRYEELFPGSDCRDWHHYAIVWDVAGIANLDGTPKKVLLVDGKPVSDVQNEVRAPEEVCAIISFPTLLSFTHDPSQDPEFTTKSPFLIDEFKIWNYAKTDFEL